MATHEIAEIQRILLSRLDTLDHILDVGEKHLPEFESAMQERLAPDMFPLGAQVAFACNQPRGFSQWCAGKAIENLAPEVDSVALARSHIRETKALVAGIDASDSKLDEIKRIGLGPGRYCELPARQYVSEYLLPNLYFHITAAYAILRKLGVPVGKSDYMRFLAPHVKVESAEVSRSTLDLWQWFATKPGGKWAFSRLLCLKAPYFGSIRPRFEDLRPGHCEVRMRKRRAVLNHIGSAHAVAMCNMAELAGGTMTEVSIPPTHRWIPKGMAVQYLKLARTDLVAVATPRAQMDWSVPGEFQVDVVVRDRHGEVVFEALITMWVAPRKATLGAA